MSCCYRCMISKNVKPDEIGKILAFVGAVQAFIPIVSSPMFGLIYRSTVENFPQAYIIVLAGLFALDWLILAFIDRGMRNVDKKKKRDMDQAIEMTDQNVTDKFIETENKS